MGRQRAASRHRPPRGRVRRVVGADQAQRVARRRRAPACPAPGASVLKLRYTEARQRLMDLAARVLDRGCARRAPTSPAWPTASSSRSGSTRCPTRSPPAPRRSSATSSASASSACPEEQRDAVHFLPTADQVDLQHGVRDLLASASRWSDCDGRLDAVAVAAARRHRRLRAAHRAGTRAGRVRARLRRARPGGRARAAGRVGVARRPGAGAGHSPSTAASSPLLVPHLDVASSLLVLDRDERVGRRHRRGEGRAASPSRSTR